MISDAEMAHLKTLARLELSEAETEGFRGDLNRLLEYFGTLSQLDTEDVEPLARPVETHNVFRDDAARKGLEPGAAAALGVATENGFFRVPRTVEGGE
jgi:aspartyl-tRNA(Asn)/glutamyl-tRNA(Gln) amidotransferase subunit C